MCRRGVLIPCLLAAILRFALPDLVQAGDGKPHEPDDGAIVVTLRPSATVEQALITVADVATLQGGPLGLRERIAALDLAEMPAVGRTVMVAREQIVYRVQLAGIDAQKLRVEGPAQALVKMATVELTTNEIVKTAQKAILDGAQIQMKDAAFRLLEEVRLPPLNLTPNDQVSLAVEGLPAAAGAGKVHVNVTIYVNGQRRGVAVVSLEMLLYRQAAIAARHIEAGEVLTKDHIHLERRPFPPDASWLPYSSQLLGKRALHTIYEGQAIRTGDLDLPPAEDEFIIRTRDNVKLIATIHNLTISAVGEALQDGKLGQNIRARNVDSGKTVIGRVVGRSTVEVEY